jgi:hypothetical protein
VYSVEVLCSPYLVSVLICWTYFVMSVVNLPQSRRQNPLLLEWRGHMNYILAVKMGIRQELGTTFMLQEMFVVCMWLAVRHTSQFLFAVSMAWRKQKNNLCYFCLTKINIHNSKSKHTIVYPTILSGLRPVEPDNSQPIPKSPQQ